ncbi:MAG TPA: glucose-1-phosphate adenylyltransferase [Chloroflexi bacterium]|nr:glucose-1-phosphate adenylyltransferase [Chloroflexota bacterium]
MKVRAVILAGGEGTRLGVLTRKRAKPAVPFAGKYRIIDFTLSNCVNSGIFDVMVLTQYRPHSLNQHIGKGRPWDLDRSFSGGVQLLQPYRGRADSDWYAGTADAVYQNMNLIRGHPRPDLVLILSGDHVYQMNYAHLIAFHQENEADATVCTINVPIEEASRYGIMEVDDKYRIVRFVEKPARPPGTLASMGVYLFRLDVLDRVLRQDAARTTSTHDFGRDVIPRMIEDGLKVYAFPFNGYWVDVGTIEAYWETHMDLLARPPAFDLNDRSWVIHTRSEERPPVRIEANTTIRDSLITDGSVIAEGAVVERSVLSPGVYIGPDAVVRESIILTDTYIEASAVVERAIIDKNCVVGHGARVGRIEEQAEDLGIVTIGKNTHLPTGIVVGRGARIGSDLQGEDFEERTIPDNAYIHSAIRDED